MDRRARSSSCRKEAQVWKSASSFSFHTRMSRIISSKASSVPHLLQQSRETVVTSRTDQIAFRCASSALKPLPNVNVPQTRLDRTPLL